MKQVITNIIRNISHSELVRVIAEKMKRVGASLQARGIHLQRVYNLF
jgi:hypothetical protein